MKGYLLPMRNARVIHYQRQYPQSSSPRFILAALLAFTVAIVVFVLAVADLSYGQDKPALKPKTGTGPAKPAATAAKPVTPIAAPAPGSNPPAQAPTPATTPPADPCTVCKGPYCPTLLQCKDLTIAQDRVIIAIQSYNNRVAREEVQWDETKQKSATTDILVDTCRRVMAENKWPATVRCDLNTSPVTFVVPGVPGDGEKKAADAPVKK
jgi:hypothetical protein